ncbi:hypothetical protein R3X25_05265 [Lutibacter sp. TH_r2]|uniref:hypothetical protein n=1 Tax=Lutibacter sp. TH_r2 TaxID=3082083 RepID=UPI002952FA9D|nr:hypothetical protein [Lutibacter sp. TH_r2]MDV7186683.1 hypothetical protein [Lutibacter sp. TH_r2]
MNTIYKNLVEKWTQNQSFEEKIVTLFEKVRDIPYGNIGSRNPLDILEQNRGTCSGKHFLLKELYKAIDVPVRDFIVMHSFNDMDINFPPEIKEFLTSDQIIDPHNYIQIKPFNKWITIDATWNLPLKKYNFPVNEFWNGKTSMPISVVVSTNIYETSEPENLKKQLIEKLSIKQQKSRKLFLNLLTNWLLNI